MNIVWEFSLKSQVSRYKFVKNRLKTNFYKKLHFYVLPFMPKKFRNRVIFLPLKCEPEEIYKKQKTKLQKIEKEWKTNEKEFLKKVTRYFPKAKNLKININPTFYGSIGSYQLEKNKITIYPRYDRNLESIQKLLVNAFVHYFNYPNNISLDLNKNDWYTKQLDTDRIQTNIFPKSKKRNIITILDREFAGNLAQESCEYLKKLGMLSETEIKKPVNLTKNENRVFNLLFNKKNTLVTFEEIGNVIWNEESLNKYSEYAITKLIERLKKKLPKNIIHPQRGIGYILVK